MLTQERLCNLVHYNPETGEFTRISAYHKSKIGKVANGRNAKGHMQMTVGGRNHLLHRLAWLYVHGTWPKDQIDHIDNDRSNNRIANLREATNAENGQNRTKATTWNKSSGLLGCSLNKKTGRWAAAIRKGDDRKHLGLFDTKEEAHHAYLKAKADLHPFGEVAKGYRK